MLMQRRHFQREYAQPVIQIFAESAFDDGPFQIAMGGSDDPHVTTQSACATDALIHTLLQNAQQLDLHWQAHVTDLVQEQRAALGQLETPLARTDCTGEGTFLVAEQFALE